MDTNSLTTRQPLSWKTKAFAFLSLLLCITVPFATFAHEVHPVGFSSLDWKTPQIARVTTSLLDFQSGAMVLSWSGLGRVETIGERSCLVGPYFLFDIDDEWAFDIDETVTLRLELARGNGAIVSWDHAASAPVAQTAVGTLPGGAMEFTLDRARFGNRLFNGSDLAIAATGAVYPYDPSSERDIAICGITLERSNVANRTAVPKGRIELQLFDLASGAKTAARVGLFDASGRMPLASDDAVPVRRYAQKLAQVPVVTSREFWPAPGGYAFYVDGSYRAEVPAGDYELVVMKGPEYHIERRAVHIQADKVTPVDVQLRYWDSAPENGWYSGDVHVHVTRRSEDNPEVLAQMRGEDLHVTNVLQMANVVRSHFPQYAFGPAGRYLQGDHTLVSGQESPRSGHRGHTIGLNGTRYHEPGQFFLYHEVAEAIRADGGLFGYAHLLGDAFHVARGMALDAPLGLVDFVEILQFGVLGTEIYYDMLNLGLRIAPAGGSDYPYIDLPGAARSYVHIDGTFNTDKWFEGLRKGRTFVSNAPLLELEVNGAGMGETVRITSGDTLAVRAGAQLNPDLDRLDRIELIVHGKVVASVQSASGAETLVLTHRLTLTEGAWVALRAYGKGIAVAHSAPIYIQVGDSPATFSRLQVPELVKRYQNILAETLTSTPVEHEDLEHFDTGTELAYQWQAQLSALREQAALAHQRLETIRTNAMR